MTQEIKCPAKTRGVIGSCRGCLYHPVGLNRTGRNICLVIIQHQSSVKRATCDYVHCNNEILRPVILEERGPSGERSRWFCCRACMDAQIALEQSPYETG